ncbi:MAG: hypothetical protein JW881_16325 [Spirochaetales bacterium]|nr:hypothetical protein [Spirochaetales bacterium]
MLRRKTAFRTIMILFSFLAAQGAFTENGGYTVRLVDTDGNNYQLEHFSRNGYEHFNCMIRETVFRLEFSDIRSITFTDEEAIAEKGHRQASVVLPGSQSSVLLIDSDTVEVSGTEIDYGIRLHIPLEQVRSITFIMPSSR